MNRLFLAFALSILLLFQGGSKASENISEYSHSSSKAINSNMILACNDTFYYLGYSEDEYGYANLYSIDSETTEPEILATNVFLATHNAFLCYHDNKVLYLGMYDDDVVICAYDTTTQEVIPCSQEDKRIVSKENSVIVNGELFYTCEQYDWGDNVFRTSIVDGQIEFVCTIPVEAAFTVDQEALYYVEDDLIYVANHDGDESKRLWPGFFRNIVRLQQEEDYLYFVANNAIEESTEESPCLVICRMHKNDYAQAEIIASVPELFSMIVKDNKVYYTSENELYMLDIATHKQVLLGKVDGEYQSGHLAVVNNNIYIKTGMHDLYYCYDTDTGTCILFPDGITVNEYLEKQVPHE